MDNRQYAICNKQQTLQPVELCKLSIAYCLLLKEACYLKIKN
jgi:hypothetical protein